LLALFPELLAFQMQSWTGHRPAVFM